MLASCTILASSASAAFDLKKLSTYSTEGDAGIYSRDDKPGTGLVRISPWHDIPFTLGKDEQGVPLLSFVCEIPRGTREKFEQVFQACDTDNSRTLERDEFQRFFHEMKAHPHRRNSADSRAFLDELSKTPRAELRRALKLR